MVPGYLSKQYELDQIRIDLNQLAIQKNAFFIEAQCIQIRAQKKQIVLRLTGGEHIGEEINLDYFVVSFNIGSINKQINCDNGFDSQMMIYVRHLEQFIFKVQDRIIDLDRQGEDIQMLVVGAGAAGIELSLAFRQQFSINKNKDYMVSIINSRSKLFINDDDDHIFISKVLSEKGIKVFNNHYFLECVQNSAIIIDRSSNTKVKLKANLIIICSGSSSFELFINSSIKNDNGYLLVNKYLQSLEYDNIFGAGDCIDMVDGKIQKAGVFSVRQGPIITENIMRYIQNRPQLLNYVPQKQYLVIINACDGNAISFYHYFKCILLRKNSINFKIKNYLDKSFIKQFQKNSSLSQTQQHTQKNNALVYHYINKQQNE